MVKIYSLAEMAMNFAKKRLSVKHIAGPLGVRGRNSDNRLIAEKLGWAPSRSLQEGLGATYKWIDSEVRKNANVAAFA
jgi:GDP-D-mannose 3',5'-epimerase